MAGQYEAPRRRRTKGPRESQGPQGPRRGEGRPRKRRLRWGRVIALVLVALLLVAGIGACAARSYYKSEVEGARRPEGEIQVEIPMGSGTARIADILQKKGVIGNSYIFRYYSRENGADGTYQYGTFTLDPREGYDGIIRRLQEVQNHLETVRITFPEGTNAFQIGEELEEIGLCTRDEFLDALEHHDFAVDFIGDVSDDPLKLVRLEGFLFPDTYEFYIDEDVDSIILRMLENFRDKVLTPEHLSTLEERGWTLDQWAALASVIQKESFTVEEMYNVSSVFAARLAEDSPYPKLESNTTSDFISDWILPWSDGEPDPEQVAAYDTYDWEGLPIGAICNAGADAFDAALHPENNTLDDVYYFFVTDVEYNYYYGRTFQEHLNNIDRAVAVNRNYGIEGLVQ